MCCILYVSLISYIRVDVIPVTPPLWKVRNLFTIQESFTTVVDDRKRSKGDRTISGINLKNYVKIIMLIGIEIPQAKR